MGSSVRLPLVRYYWISALIVGFWIVSSAFLVTGRTTAAVIRHDDARAYYGRVLMGMESEVVVEGEGDEEEGFEAADLSPLEKASEEELGALQASLARLYHSPGFFALNYEEMLSQMRIWVYPEQGGSKYEHRFEGAEADVTEDLTSTADLFFRLLKRSDFVADSPASAHLFLMPVSVDALWVDLGPKHIADQLRRYVQKIRETYPFWDSSLGADHVYLSCHAFEDNCRHRNMLEFGKNAIQAACGPLKHDQQFFPHKDMVFSEYKPVTADETHAALFSRPARVTLAYFPAGTVPPVADPGFEVEVDPSPHRSSLYSKLARSKFCVSAPPHESLSVVDALRFGCVPVLVSSSVFHDLPFQGFLNWREFAIVLGVDELPNLKSVLERVSAAEYRRMQYLGHQASKHLEWNNPPVAYDAFHMTLLELWVRRHSIKYARRNAFS